MDLKELERFVITAEHGSIGAAALRLGLSQPALTRSIRMLEDSIGSPLFDRVPRGVKLTPLGAKILPYARLIVRERAQLKEVVDEFIGLPGAQISFGVTANLLDSIGVACVAQFQKTRPDVRLALTGGLIGTLFEKVQDGSLDLALCTVGSYAIPDDLSFEPLFDNLTSIVVRRDHPLAARRRVSFQDLAAARWLVMSEGISMDGLRRTFTQHGATAPAPAIRCESLSFIRNCLLQDDYVAMLDQRYIADDIAQGTIKIIMTESPGVTLASGLIYRKGGPRISVINNFMQVIRRCAEKLG